MNESVNSECKIKTILACRLGLNKGENMKNFFLLFCVLIYTNLYAQQINNYNFIVGDLVAPTTNEEARINYNNGTESLHQNDLDNAEKYFLKAIELDPGYIDAIDHLGIVYRRQTKYEEAIKMYQKSISLNDKNYVPYINLALVYKLQNRYEDARLTYLKVIEFDKENPEPYYGIGQLYLEVEMYEECIDFMQIALNKYYNNDSMYLFDASYNIAYAYYFMGSLEDALKYFKFTATYYTDNQNIQNIIEEIESTLNSQQN